MQISFSSTIRGFQWVSARRKNLTLSDGLEIVAQIKCQFERQKSV